jgi:peptidoglycan/xylan/chitin deacetylase (PgdA/CDA1 family)
MSIYAKHGLGVRLAYLAFAMLWWVFARFFGLFKSGPLDVVVLCYHAVTSSQRERFAWQMSRIASRAMDIRELSAPVSTRDNRPRVCITFDDGFDCLIENALPVLRKFGIPVMIFPVMENLRKFPKWNMAPNHPDAKRVLMSSDEIIWLAHEGLCRFGSHTQTHPDLARIASPLLRQEMFASRLELERLVGSPVEDLALPFGSYDQEVLSRAFEAGYRRVFTLDSHLINPGRANEVVGRFSMSPDVWPVEFLLTIDGAYAWLGAGRNLYHGVQHKLSHVFQGALSST